MSSEHMHYPRTCVKHPTPSQRTSGRCSSSQMRADSICLTTMSVLEFGGHTASICLTKMGVLEFSGHMTSICLTTMGVLEFGGHTASICLTTMDVLEFGGHTTSNCLTTMGVLELEDRWREVSFNPLSPHDVFYIIKNILVFSQLTVFEGKFR